MVALAGSRRGLLPDVVGRVRRLIDAGVPKTSIAAQEGIHRATVHKIAAGTHPEQTRGRLPRCPTCGYTVVFPCRRCELLGIEPTAEPMAVTVTQSERHNGHRAQPQPQERCMSQQQIVSGLEKLAAAKKQEAAAAEARAAELREQATQLQASAEILAGEPEAVPAKKPAPRKPAPPPAE